MLMQTFTIISTVSYRNICWCYYGQYFLTTVIFMLISKVRRSVCQSLRRLGTLSSAFSVEAMNYLMDMLNDDEIAVRLQALETMHCMASHDHLFIPSAHMHMVSMNLYSLLAYFILHCGPTLDDSFTKCNLAYFRVVVIFLNFYVSW